MSTTTRPLPSSPPTCIAEPSSTSLPEMGFVRESGLLRILPFSHSTLWRRVAAKTFPAPIKLSERMTVWRVEDVRAWIRQQGGTPST